MDTKTRTIASGFSLSDARVGTVEGGEPGVLLWKAGMLVAVLTHIDEELYETSGKWFLEAGFGLLNGQHKSFDTIEEAVSFVESYTYPVPAADGGRSFYVAAS